MKKIWLSALVMIATSSVMAEGNAEVGKTLTTACVACHAEDGNSLAPSFPKLAGQQEKYLLKQLKDIQTKKRDVVQMAGQLDKMNEQNLADIAAYFASNAVVVGQADPELVTAGEALYRSGNSKTGVPACTACHGPTGKGLNSAAFPALAGQHADYTKAQLKLFQREERTNDPANIMRDIAFKMNDREIDAVASYIQGLY